MNLVGQMLHHMSGQGWRADGDRYLLAVSGGRDSSVMAALFHAAGLPFALAHCNFQLRGEASYGDEQFVRQMAERYRCPFFSIRFDTAAFAEKQRLSVQMAARQLRYDWLETTRQSEGYRYIATAHHLNDSIETLIYNLAKGCGLRGLHGIPPQNGAVIRPLLFAASAALESYQAEHRVAYREDASNAELKYQRNYIRHRLLPALQLLNPNLEETMAGNMRRFRESEYLLGQFLQQLNATAFQQSGEEAQLLLSPLQAYEAAWPTVFYELLRPYGINKTQAEDLAKAAAGGTPGAVFHTGTHRVLYDREAILVVPEASARQPTSLLWERETEVLVLPDGRLSKAYHSGQPEAFSSDSHVAQLSGGVLAFPLRLRRWQPGDRFQPLGMGGQHQKLQDFFSNNKLSRFDKERVWVLEDASGRIAWVVGHRISHAFRITGDSSGYWSLKYRPQS